MLIHKLKLSSVLKTLVPKDQEELTILQWVVESAQSLQRASLMDLGLGRLAAFSHSQATTGVAPSYNQGQQLLEQVPEDCKRYLHGLVEALDIYQTIYGKTLRGQSLSLSDKSVHELRQIRDMCLEEGLRSIY